MRLETLEPRVFVAGSLTYDGNQLHFSSPVFGGTSLNAGASGTASETGDSDSATAASPVAAQEPSADSAATAADEAGVSGGGTTPEDGSAAASPDAGPDELTQQILRVDDQGLPLPAETPASSTPGALGGDSASPAPLESPAGAPAATASSASGEQQLAEVASAPDLPPGTQWTGGGGSGGAGDGSTPPLTTTTTPVPPLIPDTPPIPGVSQSGDGPATLYVPNVSATDTLPDGVTLVRELAQQGGSPAGRGSAAADGQGNVTLQEGDSFLVTAKYHYTIPRNPGTLQFSYQDLGFDTSATNGIRDAFEVAFVGPDGRSLVPTFAPGRDAFINVTEGLGAVKAVGVTANVPGSDAKAGSVSVDISAIAPGAQATLVFRLINNDADHGSRIRILTQQPPLVQVGVQGTLAADCRSIRYQASGSAVAESQITKLEARWDSAGTWQDITASLSGANYSLPVPALSSGMHTLRVRAWDANNLVGKAQTSFRINAAPVAVAGSYGTLLLGSSIPLDGSGSSDPDGTITSYTWHIAGPGIAGTEDYGPSADPKAFSFRPTQSGTYQITLDVTDSDGQLVTSTPVTLHVIQTNHAPGVQDGAKTLLEDQSLSFTAADFTSRYSDTDGDPLEAITLVSVPQHGSLTLAGDAVTAGQTIAVADLAQLSYAPNANFNGADAFQWTASDGQALATPPATMSLEVTAVNDAPRFTPGGDVTVDEDAGSQNLTWAGNLNPGPADEAGQGLRFEIQSNSNPDLFAEGQEPVIQRDGTLVFTPAANAHGSATITLVLKDSGGTANGGIDASTTQTFTIRVNPVNDAPVVTDDTWTLPENAPKGTLAGTVQATDADARDTLTYVIVGGNDGGAFAIDPTTGKITVADATKLDYETTPSYVLKVQVSDSATPSLSGSALITIHLTNVSEAPVASDQSVTTQEDTPISGKVTASDEEKEALTYTLVDKPLHGTVAFQADGLFTYTPAADYNGSDSFTFKAKDGAVDSNLATVTITISPVNDAPVVTDATWTLAENTPEDTLAGMVQGSDVDGAEHLQYTILSGNESGAFAMDPATGRITVAKSALLDYETGVRHYTLLVQVSDGGTPVLSSQATITINLLDVNEAPAEIHLSKNSIAENQPSGTAIGTLTTVDQDEGDHFSYSLVSGAGSNDNDQFEIVGDQLLTRASFDYETRSSYSIRVRSTDSGGLWSEQVFTIQVTNVNEPPVITSLPALGGQENQRVNLAGYFTDPDAGESHSITIDWGDGTTSLADHVRMLNGQGTFTAAHSYEQPGVYTITASVDDLPGVPSAAVQTTATIADVQILATGGYQIPALANVPFVDQCVATFVDPAGPESLEQYSATIYWGDGQSSTGTIRLIDATAKQYAVLGGHLYTANDSYVITVRLQHNALPPVSVTSSASVAYNGGIILLDPSASGALTVSGNGQAVISGISSVVVNSNSPSAVTLHGNARVKVAELDVAGGVRLTGQSAVEGKIINGATPAADPFATLPVPAAPLARFGAVHVTDTMTRVLQPGTYVGGIHVSGNASVRLEPGIYYLQGGGLSVSGNGQVTGDGVMLYNDAQSSTDTIALTGNGLVRLSAPVSGTYAGMLLFQKRSSTAEIKLAGNGQTTLRGAIYGAHAPISLTGNGSLNPQGQPADTLGTTLVADTMKIAGNGSFLVDHATPATKFYVVDKTADSLFRYQASGTNQAGSALSAGNGESRGVASNASGTRLWVIDASSRVFLYDSATGSSLGAWQAAGSAGQDPQNPQDPQGLATDGTHVWTVSAADRTVRYYAHAAARTSGSANATSSFPLNAANVNPSDITTDGTSLWVTDDSADQVFVYTLTGQLRGSWALDAGNADVSGITLIPGSSKPDLWTVDRVTRQVYHYPTGRTTLSGSLTAAGHFVLAGENTSPEGIADPESQGSEFWLAAPPYWGTFMRSDIVLSAAEETVVTVSAPQLGFFRQVTVPTRQAIRVDIPTGVHRLAGGFPSGQTPGLEGIHVRSLDGKLFSAYVTGINPLYSGLPTKTGNYNQAYLGLPANTLGTEYMLAGAEGQYWTGLSTLKIVATQDNTQVTLAATVPLSYDAWSASPEGGGTVIGTDLPVLNAGQTFTLSGPYHWKQADPGPDYTGSIIRSNHPIAVIIGGPVAERGQDRFADLNVGACEQLPPVSLWKQDYALLPLDVGGGYASYKIVAAEDGTAVTIDGVTKTIDAGKALEGWIDHPMLVHASKPVLALQMTNTADASFSDPTTNPYGQGAPAEMMVVPGLNAWYSRYDVDSPHLDQGSEDGRDTTPPTPHVYWTYTDPLPYSDYNYYDNFAAVVLPERITSLFVDGKEILTSSFATVGQYNGVTYKWGQVKLEGEGSHNLHASEPFGAYIFGRHRNPIPGLPLHQRAEYSYAYPAGYNFTPTTTVSLSLSPQITWRTVGTTQRIQAQVTVSTGSLAGHVVSFTRSGANGTSTPIEVVTDASGIATLSYTGSIAGTDTITATCEGLTAQPVKVYWKADAPSVQIQEPAHLAGFALGSTVLITGQATAGTPSNPIVRVTLNGRPVDTLDASGRFFARVQITRPFETFTVVATDFQGQYATDLQTLQGLSPEAFALSQRSDQTLALQPRYGRTSYNQATGILYADVQLYNAGSDSLHGGFEVLVKDLTRQRVTAVEADGERVDDKGPILDADGKIVDAKEDAYYVLQGPDSSNTLLPRALSQSRTLAFANPDAIGFGYQLQVFAGANHAPRIVSLPPQQAVIGREYRYIPAAEDADGDQNFSWSLSAGPLDDSGEPRVKWDAARGGFVWTPQASDAGLHTLTVQVADGYGAYTQQTYSLSVGTAPANRAPVFTTMPQAWANLHGAYSSRFQVVDPDGDRVTLSLDAPSIAAGFSLADSNPDDDQVNDTLLWHPSKSGNVSVTLIATEQTTQPAPALKTQQTLTLTVGPDATRHAPVIISQPVPASVFAGQKFVYDADALDADGDIDHWEKVFGPDDLIVDRNGHVHWDKAVAPANGKPIQVGLKVVDKTGWSDTQLFDLTVLTSGMSGVISGHVFLDEDADGLHGAAEKQTLSGQTLFLDTNANGRLDAAEPVATTDVAGVYGFGNLVPGSYRVVVLPQEGYRTSSPARGMIETTVASGQTRNWINLGLAAALTGGNHAPKFSSTPVKQTQAGALYLYDAHAFDPDGTNITYSLLEGPAGMVVDPVSGVVAWRALPSQVGSVSVTLLATDQQGQSVEQPYTIEVAPGEMTQVTAGNRPALILSQPDTHAQTQSVWSYAILAVDPEGLLIAKYSLVSGPAWLKVDEATGQCMGIPQDPGPVDVVLQVQDSAGNLTQQGFTLQVTGRAANLPPVITSSPPTRVRAHAKALPYSYAVQAYDPEGDALTWTLKQGPTSSNPDHQMTISPSGVIRWRPDPADPTHLGSIPVVLQASDGSNAVLQSFVLKSTGNQAPVFSQPLDQTATAGATLRYQLPVLDADGDDLTFLGTALPEGMSINSMGVLSFKPTLAQIGQEYTLSLQAQDSLQTLSAETRSFSVKVVADTQAPEVTLFIKRPVIAYNPLSEIEFRYVDVYVSARDNVAVDSITLMEGTSPVDIPVWGGWHTVQVPHIAGIEISLKAFATDNSGNVSPAVEGSIRVIDAGQVPLISLTSPAADAQVTGLSEITGSVFVPDGGVVNRWTLSLSGEGVSRVLATGTSAVQNGKLAELDPTLLPNGHYTLTLEASAKYGGAATPVTREFDITGNLKVGNFRFSETDVTIPLAGIPLTLSRSYDSLNAGQKGDFGYGWSYDLSMGIREAGGVRLNMPLDGLDVDYGERSRPQTLSIRSYVAGTTPWAVREVEGVGSVFSDPTRDVWVTLPGQTGKVRFQFYTDGQGNVRYAAPKGVYATLSPLPGTSRFSVKEGLAYWDELGLSYGDLYYRDPVSGDVKRGSDQQAMMAKYDIPGYVLSLPDGTTFTFKKKEDPTTEGRSGLRVFDTDNEPTDGLYSYVSRQYLGQPVPAEIRDANGNTIKVTPQGLEQVLAPGSTDKPLGITFDRENGRIVRARVAETAEQAANGTGKVLVRYGYTPQGDLDHVDRLVNASAADEDKKWQTTYYHYEFAGKTSTHRIKSITSDSGKTPIVNEYDNTGRLVATVDAAGNRIEYKHNLTGKIETVKDRNGGQSVYEYDDRGNVRFITDAAGQVTAYEYTDSANPDRETKVTTAYGTPQEHTISYTYDAAGNKTSQKDEATGLTQTWHYIEKNGKQVLEYSVDATGIRTDNSYDPSGNLTGTTTQDRNGVVISKSTFGDYVAGNPQTVTQWNPGNADVPSAPFSRSVSLYNAQGLVTDSFQQKYARTEGTGEQAKVFWTTTSRTRYAVQPNGTVTGSTQYKPVPMPQGEPVPATSGILLADLKQNWTVELPSTSTTYDELGRSTSASSPDGKGGYLTTATEYNDDGQVWRSYDARGNYSETDYDDLGQVIATRQYDKTGKPLSGTSTTYNADGKVATSTDALGNVTSSFYDMAGRSVRTVSPDGTSSETLYDPAGRAYLSIGRHVATNLTGLYGTLSLYDTAGRVVETQRVSGLSLSITELDAANHLVSVSINTQQSTVLSRSQTFYNALGQVWKSVDANDTATWYLYDAAGRQTDTIQAVDVNQNGTVDAIDTNGDTLPDTGSERLVTHTDYDSLGRAYRTTDAKGHTTTTEYDDQGRVSRTVYHDGSFVAYGYDALGRKEWQSKQLKAGSTQAQINASKTVNEYDDLGRLRAVVLPAVADPENGGAMTHARYEYTYDRFGNQETQKDAKGRITRFEYDPLTGQQTARVLPLGQREETGYDPLGRTTWTRDVSGRTTTYHYDAMGRLKTKLFFAPGKDPGTATADVWVTYQFDELGRVEHLIDSANGTTSYEYDEQGRQTKVASPQGAINHRYDALGRLKRTFTSKTDTRYGFDGLGRLETVTMTLREGAAVPGDSLDWYGQTITGETTKYRYDQVGNLDLIQQSNGVVSDYEYDDLNRLTDLVHFKDANGNAVRDAAEATLASFHYELNADGNKASATEVDDQNLTRTFVWKYDANDRLISESLSSTDTAQQFITRFTMDLVGNRLKMATDRGATALAISNFNSSGTLSPDEVTTYSYDSNDRLAWEKKDGAGTTNDTYTEYAWTGGDQTGKTVHAGLDNAGTVTEQTTFEYNVQSRTGKITITKDGATTTITYKYNPEGIRVEEATTENGKTTTKTYLIDSSNFTGYAQVLEEYVNGALAKTFTLGHDVLTQHDATNGALTFLYDGHGSTREMLDAVANAVQRYAYEAYGTQLGGQGLTDLANAITGLLYSGEMTDKLGRQNLRDRIYDMATGRFTQSDRVADPANLHKYLYTPANPISNGDPSGNFSVSLASTLATVGIGNLVQSFMTTGVGPGYQATQGFQLFLRVNGYQFTPFRAQQTYFWGDWFFDTPVGFGESLIPIWGALRVAAYEGTHGNPGWAVFHAALAALDVLTVASTIRGVVGMAARLPSVVAGGLRVSTTLAEYAGASVIQRFAGTVVKRSGNLIVKHVDETATGATRWLAEQSLQAQVQALEALGDMAPKFIYQNGVLVMENAGRFAGGALDWLGVFLQASWRLKTVLNDVLPRNIGSAGHVFDPVWAPVFEVAVGGLSTALLSGLNGVTNFTWEY